MLMSLAGTVGQSSSQIAPRKKKSAGSSSKRSRTDSAEESNDNQPLARRQRRRVESSSPAVDSVTGEPPAPLFNSGQLMPASAPAPSSTISSAPAQNIQDREPTVVQVAEPDPSSSARIGTSAGQSHTVERLREETLGSEETVQALARKPLGDLVSSVLSKLSELSLEVRALKVQGDHKEQRSQTDVQSFTLALNQANKSLAEEQEKNEALIGKLDNACSERAELMERIRRMELEFKAALAEKEEDLRATMDVLDKQKEELKAAFAQEKLVYRDKLMAMAKGMME